jgi:hypothetical protein
LRHVREKSKSGAGRRKIAAVILMAGVFMLAGRSGRSDACSGALPAAAVVTAARTTPGGAPVCVQVGTRSEGWAWPDGRFIRWAKCKGVTPTCKTEGQGKEGEGWYDGTGLIANASCRRADRPR